MSRLSMVKNQSSFEQPSSARKALCAVLVAASLAAGCGSSGASADGGADAGADGPAATGIPSPALAVISSDYAVTSVSLYDPATGKLIDGCVKSGVTSPTLVMPLSGDVTLPTQAQQGGQLVLIDGKSAVLTFVNPASCAVTAQLSVSTGGFVAHPHDVVTLSSTKAYVTRYETNANATPDPADFDDGDDVLIVDPTLLTVTGRIALSTFAAPSATGVTTQARPDRAVLAGGLVYVTLDSISADFTATGPGRVVVIDPTTDTVTGTIDLPNTKDCSGMTYLDSQKKLYVACGGAYGEASQLDQSALVEIDLSGTTPVVARMVPAGMLGQSPINFFYASVYNDVAFVGTQGAFPDPTTGSAGSDDAFYAVALASGVSAKLASGAAGDLGAAVVDPTTRKVFLPDASQKVPLVHVYDLSAAAPAALPGFEPNPSDHLPPRAVGSY